MNEKVDAEKAFDEWFNKYTSEIPIQEWTARHAWLAAIDWIQRGRRVDAELVYVTPEMLKEVEAGRCVASGEKHLLVPDSALVRDSVSTVADERIEGRPTAHFQGHEPTGA